MEKLFKFPDNLTNKCKRRLWHIVQMPCAVSEKRYRSDVVQLGAVDRVFRHADSYSSLLMTN